MIAQTTELILPAMPELVFGAVGLLFLLFLPYWLWMLVDAIRADEAELRSGTTLVWVLVIVLLGVVGAAVYHAVGRPRRGAQPDAAG